MAARTQDAPGYYVWEAPGKPVLVHLHLDVLDRLSAEVMRGFGAVPKRGAEVGGILLGTVEVSEEGDSAIVRIEDYEAVECTYRRGPSYRFTDDEKANFGEAVERWQFDPAGTAYVVGFYRSHTRDGLSLAPEDLELLDEFFPFPETVALLIKPYGTKVSEAGFFIREEGVFPESSPLEFPFRRREITGEEPLSRRSRMERRPRESRSAYPTPISSGVPSQAPLAFTHELPEEAQQDYEYEEPHQPSVPIPTAFDGPAYDPPLPSRAPTNMWMPLAFLLLFLGIALGYMIALVAGRSKVSSDPQGFALGLSVSRTGDSPTVKNDSLTVRWDRQAPAIRAAMNGTLEIEENGFTKPVPIDSALLQTGSVVVQKPTHSVRFRLIVHPQARLSLTETAEWRP